MAFCIIVHGYPLLLCAVRSRLMLGSFPSWDIKMGCLKRTAYPRPSLRVPTSDTAIPKASKLLHLQYTESFLGGRSSAPFSFIIHSYFSSMSETSRICKPGLFDSTHYVLGGERYALNLLYLRYCMSCFVWVEGWGWFS